jgi:threonine dehydrogenase-like Zn-dependent dehydrogenase
MESSKQRSPYRRHGSVSGGREAAFKAVGPGFGMAGGHWGGTLADELVVPFADAMPLPDGVDPIAAASRQRQ